METVSSPEGQRLAPQLRLKPRHLSSLILRRPAGASKDGVATASPNAKAGVAPSHPPPWFETALLASSP
ncbi:UNVERIFIED_ORG: hypothetical protein GGD48_000087 [Rhizobium etli]